MDDSVYLVASLAAVQVHLCNVCHCCSFWFWLLVLEVGRKAWFVYSPPTPPGYVAIDLFRSHACSLAATCDGLETKLMQCKRFISNLIYY